MNTSTNACTQTEFARLMQVNKSTVTRWKQAGRLVLDDRGRVLIAESGARINASRAGREDVTERHARNRGGNIPATTDQAHEDDADADIVTGEGFDSDPPEDADSAGPARTRYKARLLRYENARIKLELSLRHGYLLPRPAVEREATSIGAMLRAALERMIDISAPQCAHATRAQRLDLLAAETRALRRITNVELARSQRRIRKETRNA